MRRSLDSGNLTNRIYDSVSLGLQQSLVSLALAYRVVDDRRGFLDIYAGVRYNFLGLQADASLNDSRIDQIGTAAADAIASRIQQSIQAKLSTIKIPSASNIESLAQTRLKNRVVEEIVARDPDLRRLILAGTIKRNITQGRVVEAMNTYVRAEAQALAARAQTRAALASPGFKPQQTLRRKGWPRRSRARLKAPLRPTRRETSGGSIRLSGYVDR